MISPHCDVGALLKNRCHVLKQSLILHQVWPGILCVAENQVARVEQKIGLMRHQTLEESGVG